jgi:hypothetical protein
MKVAMGCGSLLFFANGKEHGQTLEALYNGFLIVEKVGAGY